MVVPMDSDHPMHQHQYSPPSRVGTHAYWGRSQSCRFHDIVDRAFSYHDGLVCVAYSFGVISNQHSRHCYPSDWIVSCQTAVFVGTCLYWNRRPQLTSHDMFLLSTWIRGVRVLPQQYLMRCTIANVFSSFHSIQWFWVSALDRVWFISCDVDRAPFSPFLWAQRMKAQFIFWTRWHLSWYSSGEKISTPFLESESLISCQEKHAKDICVNKRF